MKSTRLLLPFILAVFSMSTFAQEAASSASDDGTIFDQVASDLNLSGAEAEELNMAMLMYFSAFSEVVDDHDRMDADPMAIYRDINAIKEGLYTVLAGSFPEETVEKYKELETEYEESFNFVVAYLRVLTLTEIVGLNEDQQNNLYVAMQEPVTKMAAVHALVDYIYDFITDEAIEELQAGLNAGHEYEKQELKRVLTHEQYDKWLNL